MWCLLALTQFGSIWFNISDTFLVLQGCHLFTFSSNNNNVNRKKNWLPQFVCFPIFLALTEHKNLLPNVFLCLNFEQKSLFWNNWKQTRHSSDWHRSSLLCLPGRNLYLQMKHDNDRTFPVPMIDLLCLKCRAILQSICIAITMEWRRVQTSKTLFYFRTVTWRDAPIQIKYIGQNSLYRGLHMACGKPNQHKEEMQFPVRNMSYISNILSSDNKVMVEL